MNFCIKICCGYKIFTIFGYVTEPTTVSLIIARPELVRTTTTMTKSENQSDECLLELLRQGDGVSFRILYERYWDKLYTVAFQRLDDRYEAEEVVQDIYVKLWQRREGLRIETELCRYLSVAVKYEVINRLAKRSRILKSTVAVKQSLYMGNEYDLHKQIDHRRLLVEIERSIQELPDKCNIVFSLSRKEYFSHQMIASKLNISEKMVQKHIASALKTLRKKYANFLSLLLLLSSFF
jgi:RNA polymerase sigma factor (sigma-70 family)